MDRYITSRLALPALALVAAAAALLLAPRPADAIGGSAGEGFGLGVILGDPSGLTGKYWLGRDEAIDFHLAFDLDDDDDHNTILLMADYLMHFDVFNLKTSNVDLPIYVGIGGKLGFFEHDHDNDRHGHDNDDELGLGLRIPVGISCLLAKAPLEFFLEIAPAIWLIPSTDAHVDAGLGARFYF